MLMEFLAIVLMFNKLPGLINYEINILAYIC